MNVLFVPRSGADATADVVRAQGFVGGRPEAGSAAGVGRESGAGGGRRSEGAGAGQRAEGADCRRPSGAERRQGGRVRRVRLQLHR